jgi:hypothetical protein
MCHTATAIDLSGPRAARASRMPTDSGPSTTLPVARTRPYAALSMALMVPGFGPSGILYMT